MDKKQLDIYTSKGGKIKVSRSSQHVDLWNIEEIETRKAHALHTSKEVVLSIYPKD